MRNSGFIARAALCLAGLLLCGFAQAQAYPNRQIRLIVPYPPGGGTDFFARTVGAKMGELLGQQIVIENRPGASGIIGAEALVKSPNDGYTMILGDTATYALNVSLFKKIPYDPLKDFSFVSLTANFALLLMVHPSVQANNVKELVDLAKSKGGQMDYASPGLGTPHHMAMEVFKQRSGVNFVHVPYKGGAPARQDLIAGRVPVMVLDLVTAVTQVKAGKVRALATTTPKRLAPLPDLPTIDESGFPGFNAPAWQGFSLPAGASRDVVMRLNSAFHKAITDQELSQKLVNLGAQFIPSTPEEMGAFVKSEIEKWGAAVRAGNISLD